jgi:hypothetical protein
MEEFLLPESQQTKKLLPTLSNIIYNIQPEPPYYGGSVAMITTSKKIFLFTSFFHTPIHDFFASFISVF